MSYSFIVMLSCLGKDNVGDRRSFRHGGHFKAHQKVHASSPCKNDDITKYGTSLWCQLWARKIECQFYDVPMCRKEWVELSGSMFLLT